MKRHPVTGAPDFWDLARDFLHTYLPAVRAASARTIEAYRISLECFLGFLIDHQHIARTEVTFDCFDRAQLKAWLAWMNEHQRYAPRTITLRLTAIRAFLAYAAAEDITLVALHNAASTLKPPAVPKSPIAYLSEEETRALLVAHAGHTPTSRRNRMLLILLYDTAARVSEITRLTLADLSLTHPGHVMLTGKRRKTRVVPLTEVTIGHLHVYLDEFHPDHAALPHGQATVLQPPSGTTSPALGRYRRERAHRRCRHRTSALPPGPGEGSLSHAPHDQSDGPLPARCPVADHHAPPRPREHLDHERVLRLRDPRHDARRHQRRHPHAAVARISEDTLRVLHSLR